MGKIKNYRIGDYIVYGGKIEKITGVSPTNVYCGLTVEVPVESAVSPALTEKFFKDNDFVYEESMGERTYMLGHGETFILAIVRENHFGVRVRNRVYEFNGVVDDLNEFLHIVDCCAIRGEFVCE